MDELWIDRLFDLDRLNQDLRGILSNNELHPIFSGDWTERELHFFAKKRESELKLINELETLTPIERKFHLSNSKYVAAETVDDFLRDQSGQDEMAEIPHEELLQIAESVQKKLKDAQSAHRALTREFIKENRELILEAVDKDNREMISKAFRKWMENH